MLTHTGRGRSRHAKAECVLFLYPSLENFDGRKNTLF